MKTWLQNHVKATLAIVGSLLIWCGLALLWTFPYMLITTGAAMIVIPIFSYLED